MLGNVYVRTHPVTLGELESTLDIHRVGGQWTCKMNDEAIDQVFTVHAHVGNLIIRVRIQT